MNIRETPFYIAGSYTGISEASPALYVPMLHRRNYDWNSDFTMFNAGTATTRVTVQYVASTGSGCTTSPLTIPPNGSRSFNQRYDPGCSLSTPFVGAARVTNNNGQPLTAVANQWLDVNDDGILESYMTYEAFSIGRTPNFLPLLMRNNYGWHTGISLQDTSGSGANATLHYFSQDNGNECGSSTHWLGANGVNPIARIPPDGVCVPRGELFVGAARADRGRAFVTIVNQVNASSGNRNGMSYSASSGGTSTAVVPLVMKNRDGWQGRDNWFTGLSVQNVSATATTVTVSYYNADGTFRTSESRLVPGYTDTIFNPAPGDPEITSFLGSAVVTATGPGGPIAVVVNHVTSPSGTDDTSMSHSGVNR